MRPELWAAVGAAASDYYGLITRTQLLALGVSSDAINRLLRSGRITSVRRGVYALTGVPGAVERHLAAAVLATYPLSGASFLGAAWLHGSERAVPGRVEITLPKSCHHRLHGAKVHRTEFWTPEDLCVVRGIQTTTPERTLADLALGMNPWTVGRIFDEFIRLGKVEAPAVLEMLDRLGRRHRGGSSILMRMALERFDIEKFTTQLETKVLLELRRRDVAAPTHQYALDVPGDSYVLDMAWVPERVGLETHGYDPHRTREQTLRDAKRRLELRKIGWELFEVTWGIDPDELATAIQGALKERKPHT